MADEARAPNLALAHPAASEIRTGAFNCPHCHGLILVNQQAFAVEELGVQTDGG
jgi:hypothetical protein